MEEQLAKYFSGELTQDEIDKINRWRNESVDNTHLFLEAKNIWSSTEQKPTADQDILKDILNEPQGKQVIFLSGWMKYAAAAVIAIGLIMTLFLVNYSNNDLRVESLADGSEITLHGTSSIESVVINDNVREVKLTGKAYFDIERDESRPFTVVTDDAKVEVLGTSFVINTYNKKTEVCVESGLVALIKPGEKGKTDLSVKLAKGEMGTVTKTNKGILKKNNSDPNYLSWKTKTLVFERSKMSDVARTLEDVYGINIVFENENLVNCNLTAKFKERKPKDAIAIIAKTFNLTFEFQGDSVVIKGKGC